MAGSVHQLSLINSPAVCSPSVEVLDRICKEAGWKLVKQLVLVLTGVCLTWGGSKKGELFRCRNLVYLYTYFTPSPMFKSRMTAICGLCWTSDGPRTFPPRFPWSTWQWIPLASFSSLAYVGSIDTACTPHGHRMDTAWTHGKKVAPCAELWDNALPQVDALGKLWVYLDVLKASRTMCNKRILLLSDIFCLHVMNVHICSYQIYSHILISSII